MTHWWQRREEAAPPTIVERVVPVEIPVLTETKRRLARGDYENALRLAYACVVDDLQRAYGRPFPPGWTHGEIVERGGDENWGHLPDFVRRLTDLYTPLRFGGDAQVRQPELLLELLQSIYAARPMWRLYLEPRTDPTPETPERPPLADRRPDSGADR